MKTQIKELHRGSANWWYCDNILDHPGKCGLLRMDFPRVFVLIRDYDIAYWASFADWKKDIVEVNFFSPSEREEADIEEILVEAWNFLALIEEEENKQYEING